MKISFNIFDYVIEKLIDIFSKLLTLTPTKGK